MPVRLHFGYISLPSRSPIASGKGRSQRLRPVVEAYFIHPTDARRWTSVPAQFDTGSDDTIVPERVAVELGVDLAQCPSGRAVAAGGQSLTLRYAEIRIQLRDNGNAVEWRARVGFSEQPLKRALLGLTGCLEFFAATFYGDREELMLVPSARIKSVRIVPPSALDLS